MRGEIQRTNTRIKRIGMRGEGMKKIFPAVTLEIESNARKLQQENMTRKAEEKLDEYCEYVNVPMTAMEIFTKNSQSAKDFVVKCVSALFRSDYVVFSADWQTHEDTRNLHVLAEVYDIPILEL